MKISDIVFEMETNYVQEDDIETIVAYIKEYGFDAQKVDDKLSELGYDEIFSDLDSDSFTYDTTEKIYHNRGQLVE